LVAAGTRSTVAIEDQAVEPDVAQHPGEAGRIGLERVAIGHYHYTDVLGPKLFLVPVLIGPAYFATGYLAWVVGNVLVGELRRGSSLFTTKAVPFIAAFVMVRWDLTLDPRVATIQQQWIWEHGGYFGVPLMNFVGWFITVYIFLQLFAVAVRSGLAVREPSWSEVSGRPPAARMRRLGPIPFTRLTCLRCRINTKADA
jgi:hypothetical protein